MKTDEALALTIRLSRTALKSVICSTNNLMKDETINEEWLVKQAGDLFDSLNGLSNHQVLNILSLGLIIVYEDMLQHIEHKKGS